MSRIVDYATPALAGATAWDCPSDCGGLSAMYAGEDFPFAQGLPNGLKCCSKCGATKTPQWREGPFGPKTLCNACGVKRTRKLRAEQEGGKRRRLAPVSTSTKVSPVKVSRAAAAQQLLNRYDSLDIDGVEMHYVPPFSSLRRPQRRAAEEAALRTARYARTGEWQEGADAASVGDELYGVPPVHTPSSSSDISHQASDCPEEVSWTPVAAQAASKGMNALDVDCYAAVNLMTMNMTGRVPEAQGSPQISSGRESQLAVASPMPPSLAVRLTSVDESKAVEMEGGAESHPLPTLPPIRTHIVATEELSDLERSLPPNKVAELVRLQQELDASLQEAATANAAIAEIAQLMATRQASALRSREQAIGATKRLRRFLSQLDTQFGVQIKGGKAVLQRP